MSSHNEIVNCPKCGLELTRNDRIANKPMIALFLSQARRYHCYLCDYSFTVYPWASQQSTHQFEAVRPVCQLPVKACESSADDHDSSNAIVDVLNQWGVLEKGNGTEDGGPKACDNQQVLNEDADPDTEEIDYRALIKTTKAQHHY